MFRLFLIGIVLSFLGARPALPATFYFAVDVPVDLGGTTYGVNRIIQNFNGTYSQATFLPPAVEVGALHRYSSGTWYFVPAYPITVGSTIYEPRDILSFNGMSTALVLDGGGIGIPEYARIDALFYQSGGYPVMSLDVPVNLGGTGYGPNDLVCYCEGVWSLYWDGDGAGVPPSSNVVGADIEPWGKLVVTFDVPTSIGGETYLPGELVEVEGAGAFASFAKDDSWPPSVQLRDFSFGVAGPAGRVPRDLFLAGGPLYVQKGILAPGWLDLTWSASCLGTDRDYAIYEGKLGNFSSHLPVHCSTGGAAGAGFVPQAGNRYFLVVPLNDTREGSYGLDSSGSQRFASGSPCLPQWLGTCP